MRSPVLAKIAGVSVGFLMVSSAFAKPDTAHVPATNTHSGQEVSIPAYAVEVAPNVFSLGTAIHEGIKVEGLMFVHRSNARRGGPGGGGNSTCYSHLAKGAKWKTPENWVLNAANNHALDSAFLLTTTDAAFGEWETAASANIVGIGSLTTSTLVADEVSPDGANEIYFGSISDPGVIAVTITWGTFGGPVQNRKLVEMDQVYDQVDFSWSNNGNPLSMDYENIAQHEIGHGIGMGHTATSTDCAAQTMYPYASNGETAKRDLGTGDIAGIAALY
jgi:hypothetical protein